MPINIPSSNSPGSNELMVYAKNSFGTWYNESVFFIINLDFMNLNHNLVQPDKQEIIDAVEKFGSPWV